MEMDKTLVPKMIGEAKILLAIRIDDKFVHTGNTQQFVDGQLLGPMYGLAICTYDNGESFYLFGCNEAWESITDTFHTTIEEAMDQAEFEYEGTSGHWIKIAE